ncbi:MAG: peptidoglycan-binding domain-containing protein [Armatimonadota bacterium]
MNLDEAVGAAFGDGGSPVADVQRALLRLGYYGIRFAIDGAFGRNTLGAVLACKYDLVTTYGMRRRDLRYAPVAGNRASLIASGSVTGALAESLRTMLNGGMLGNHEPWRLPTRNDVLDADLDLRAFVEDEAGEVDRFPPQLFREILGVESGSDHFDRFGNVKFGVDWQGQTYAQVVNFTPEASREPWVRSRGWGLSQYTPYRVAALPRPMPDYILSVRANVRTAIALFRRKFEAFTRRNPCSFPSVASPSYDCRMCLRSRGFDPIAYSDQLQQPCSWIKAVWAYNGLSAAGRKYMERVVRNLLR